MDEDLIVCPTCARARPPSERFCDACGMPLVHSSAAEHTASERQRTARKIKPEYAQGPLVKVTHLTNQPEAEFIAGLLLEEGIPCLLLEEGIPCLLRNPVAGYSPLIGPREVMVPESGAEAAREALAFQRD
jgi:hypothetical protein